MFRVKSLTLRVLLSATLWYIIALVTMAVVISALYRQGAERSFNDLLRAQLYNVVNSVTVGDGESLSGSPALGDLRFSQPGTGWYWLVEPLGSFNAAPLASTSLGLTNLPVPSFEESPFDQNYERFYGMTDSFGNRLRIAETEVILDESGRAARFRVSGNLKVVEDEITGFSHRLYAVLAMFGVGGLLVNAVTIIFGLKPLDRARRALERIRGGEAERIEGEFPREIEPLANEINALIDSNHRIVERARMQVGNLAHSLKTPIAVLLNEARVLDPPHGEVIKAQASAMQSQVGTYLNRARIAAQRESVLSRAEVEPVLERLVRVMRKLNPDKQFEVHLESQASGQGLVLAMESQDLEEILGNLLENAARHSETTVTVTARIAPTGEVGLDPGRRAWLEIIVEDDGPGLDPDQIGEALKRGRRLDESKPGTGLGLSIVKEITSEYQGKLGLSRGVNGGLLARLVLPALSRDGA
ncbi:MULTISPECIES: sensor histidine kinase [Rhizobium/Agrobacterium group]|uniref:sensor histidine kinase n=1 Tax=Rhizobium/Agrobacterium group TaxID=227290 RepID=UPI00135E31C9|nr:HAMP domain-containing sensor histidine kinase [Agrobacterium vitis]MCF1472859.1 HAMP domain-containing histidine kinase [Allorhizobium ampelinum]MVA53874.1 histidine kinase [Agrobacterium vitis]NSZ16124.1 HAMP domain-containing histidine kinase [Agrobacterium vitis]NSZ52221.1 HAMP domain-containing histidine kinase [Agrobacterium vitis]NTA30980.1 HAMP domain-containing histidine kinase [Agrobacterium vitis]